MNKLLLLTLLGVSLAGCKYYGSALNPEFPKSMDDSLAIARSYNAGPSGGMQSVIVQPVRPEINPPAYLPEKELAVVAPPQTLLVWTYPHVTDDNRRVFGSWSTIFVNDRYEWVKPINEQAAPPLPGRDS